MTQRPGRLWPLWLFPAICVVGAGALVVVITRGADPAPRGIAMGTAWWLAWSLCTLVGYGAAIVALQQKLRALTTHRVGGVACLAAVGVPLIFVLCMLVAGRANRSDQWRGASDALFVSAPIIAPFLAVLLSYLVVAGWLVLGDRRNTPSGGSRPHDRAT